MTTYQAFLIVTGCKHMHLASAIVWHLRYFD